MKRCVKCGQKKTLDNFYAAKNCKDGLHGECKACRKKYRKKYFKQHKKAISERARWHQLKSLYGLTKQKYIELSNKQLGVCAVCRKRNENNHRLVVDHDHTTGKVRGLLCHSCNKALGFLKENPIIIRQLADYVEGALPEKSETDDD